MAGKWRKGMDSPNPAGRPRGKRSKRQRLERQLVGWVFKHYGDASDVGFPGTRFECALHRLYMDNPERYVELGLKLLPKQDTLRVEGDITLTQVIQEATRIREEQEALEGELEQQALEQVEQEVKH